MKPGDTSEVIIDLKNRLRNFGSVKTDPPSKVFDEDLELAIKAFQEQNGLDADGLPGKKTYARLNISLDEYMDILRVNMERLRWIDDQLPKDYILVNIADFRLYLYRDRKMQYKNKVVVGAEFTETPVFQSEISYIEFNPTWTVPYSISSKEILPKIQQDSLYLQRNHMKIYRSGSEVAPVGVDFSQFTETNFPFTIVQQPGPWNALGTMKFIFPNKHAVYLHDSPSQYPFQRDERAFSHGCVRVYQPKILAEEVLKHQDVDRKKIDEILESGETQRVYLKEKMPIMLMYFTCYEDQKSQQIYFYRDIYGRDKRVLEGLNKTH